MSGEREDRRSDLAQDTSPDTSQNSNAPSLRLGSGYLRSDFDHSGAIPVSTSSDAARVLPVQRR